jgi:hypothetical protein
VPGCGKRSYAYRYCSTHWARVRRNGDLNYRKAPNGTLRKWIESVAMRWSSDECLRYPFHVGSHGYGMVCVGRSHTTAHRLVCELAHGPPSNPKLHAAHSCGVKTCVNPRHVRWATKLENENDKLGHGTLTRGEKHGCSKLTADDVLAIRASTGSQREIAREFGVTQQTVSDIKRKRRWAWMAN